MRKLLAMFAVLFLLGCAAAPEAAPTTSEPEVTATQPVTQPETIPETTEVPHPLQYLLDGMTTEERVGQLFLARCPASGAAEAVSAYHLGGFVLFGQDFTGQTPDSLRNKLQSYQDAAAIPLLIAVDEEGGTVTRVSSNRAFRSATFPSPRAAFSQGGMEAVIGYEAEKGKLLIELGIQVVLGPVCDIALYPRAFMYSRSLGQSPEITGEFVSKTVSTMGSLGVGCTLKHFPGYGNNGDTHTGICLDDRTLEALESFDLIPFQAGIDAGCGAIMMAHTISTAFDPQLPVSLSPAAHRYLREKMGFTGVIITDDLAMQAITDQYGVEEAAVLAVLAGNDLLCSSDYPRQYNAVLEAVRSGRIPQEMLDAAVLRILSWKHTLGLL